MVVKIAWPNAHGERQTRSLANRDGRALHVACGPHNPEELVVALLSLLGPHGRFLLPLESWASWARSSVAIYALDRTGRRFRTPRSGSAEPSLARTFLGPRVRVHGLLRCRGFLRQIVT